MLRKKDGGKNKVYAMTYTKNIKIKERKSKKIYSK